MKRISNIVFIFLFTIVIWKIPKLIIFICEKQQGYNADTIISYAGSIAGGLLTLIGVYFTVRYERERDRKEFELQSTPVLSASVVEMKNESTQLRSEFIYNFRNFCFMDDDLYYLREGIEFRNVGRGEIESAHITAKKYWVVDGVQSDIITNEMYSYILFPEYQFIPINGSMRMQVAVPKPDKKVLNIPDENKSQSMIIENTVQITLKGVFNEKESSYLCHYFVDYYPNELKRSSIRDISMMLLRPEQIKLTGKKIEASVSTYYNVSVQSYMAVISMKNLSNDDIFLKEAILTDMHNHKMGTFDFLRIPDSQNGSLVAKEQIEIEMKIEHHLEIIRKYAIDLNGHIKLCIVDIDDNKYVFKKGFPVG